MVIGITIWKYIFRLFKWKSAEEWISGGMKMSSLEERKDKFELEEHETEVVRKITGLIREGKVKGGTPYQVVPEDFIKGAIIHELVMIDALNSKDKQEREFAEKYFTAIRLLPLKNIPGADEWYWP